MQGIRSGRRARIEPGWTDLLARLYEERLDEFCSVAAAILRDRAAARDVVHDAFAAALKAERNFKAGTDLGAWVWRIVVNQALDHRRRRRRQQAVTVEGLNRADARAACAREAASREWSAPDGLEAALRALPERQRLTVFLRYFADLEYSQIAEILDVAPGTVSASLTQAHRNIRQLLQGAER